MEQTRGVGHTMTSNGKLTTTLTFHLIIIKNKKTPQEWPGKSTKQKYELLDTN